MHRVFRDQPLYIICGLYTSAIEFMQANGISRDRVIVVNSSASFYKLKAIEGKFTMVKVYGWPDVLTPEEHAEFDAIIASRGDRLVLTCIDAREAS